MATKKEIESLTFKVDITKEFAPRSRSLDVYLNDVQWILPDPDQVAYRLSYSTADWIPILRFIQTDPHVWACCQSRKSGTLCREWEIIDSDQIGQNQEKVNDSIRAWADSFDIYQIINDIIEAIFFGLSPCEVIWTHNDGLWLPEQVVGRPTEWFVFDMDNNPKFLSQSNMIYGEEIPKYKMLFPTHQYSYYNPYGERVLSRCYWPITWKRAAQKFSAILTEKYGIPHLYGKVPPGTDDDVRDALLVLLESMRQNGVAVINDDQSVEASQPVTLQSGANIFEQIINQCDAQISKGILGQTLTTDANQSGSGSYALGKIHSDVRADLLIGDERLVTNTLDTLLQWIVELNFAGAYAPYFRLHRDEDIQADRAERDRILNETMPGLRFTRTYFESQYNLLPEWLEEKPQLTISPNPSLTSQSGRDSRVPPTPLSDEEAGTFAINGLKKKIDNGGTLIND